MAPRPCHSKQEGQRQEKDGTAELWFEEEVREVSEGTTPDNHSTLPPPPGYLPPGVESLEQWGETEILHGKVCKGRSYRDVAGSTEATDVRYLKFVRAQKEPGPFLLDFQKYVEAFAAAHDRPCRPGTSIPRRFVNRASKGPGGGGASKGPGGGGSA